MKHYIALILLLPLSAEVPDAQFKLMFHARLRGLTVTTNVVELTNQQGCPTCKMIAEGIPMDPNKPQGPRYIPAIYHYRNVECLTPWRDTTERTVITNAVEVLSVDIVFRGQTNVATVTNTLWSTTNKWMMTNGWQEIKEGR